MKFRVTMKDPDGFHESIDDAASQTMAAYPELSVDEAEAIKEIRQEALRKACSKWFEYHEYLTVEIDTEAKTCVVVEVGA